MSLMTWHVLVHCVTWIECGPAGGVGVGGFFMDVPSPGSVQ